MFDRLGKLFLNRGATAFCLWVILNPLLLQADKSFQLKIDRENLDRSNPHGHIVSYADMLDEVIPAVVSISVKRELNSKRPVRITSISSGPNKMAEQTPGSHKKPAKEAESHTKEKLVYQYVDEGSGSGFIVTENGYILTNYHVLQGNSYLDLDNLEDTLLVNVRLNDGRESSAEIIGFDPATDLAVVKIDKPDLPTATLGFSEQVRVGDVVFAVGNPMQIGMAVSQGIISALNRTDLRIIDRTLRRTRGFKETFALENFIQTDAAVNRGSSGGPLVDALGRVVGINTAIRSTSGGSIGINFAIPIDLASHVAQQIVTGGKLRRGSIGVISAFLSKEKASELGLKTNKGVLIQKVIEKEAAYEAGIVVGDVILSVNKETVDSIRDITYMISSRSPGDVVELEVFRSGKKWIIPVKLSERKQYRSDDPAKDS
ncbi:MAG: trypsin-like peptidase domain-containing protein [Verrucomicrobiota bacterium]